MKYLLGFSFGYHDSSIAVLGDGEIVGIYSEERFSRIKHDKSFPQNALDYVISKYKLTDKNIVSACYYENYSEKLLRIRSQFDDAEDFAAYLTFKYTQDKLISPIQKIADALDISTNKVEFVNHHTAHLFSALTLVGNNCADESPFLALTLDGVGEFETSSVTTGLFGQTGLVSNLQKINCSTYPMSLGLFYSAITNYLGFEVNDAEFKVMGLASYGEPEFIDQFSRIVYLNKNGEIYLDPIYFDFSPDSPSPYTYKFIEEFGPPAPSSNLYVEKFSSIEDVRNDSCLANYANIAASAQNIITSILIDMVKYYNSVDFPVLIYSGGVALNTKANYTLLKEFSGQLFVPPDPGDGGSSLGAAAASYFSKYSTVPQFCSPYLGYDITDEDISDLLKDHNLVNFEKLTSTSELASAIANLINSDKVVGLVQGKAEFGPRALGNRSILANPSSENTQEFVNKAVKFREPFRPFAPVLHRDDVPTYYLVDENWLKYENNPFEYMLATLPARDIAKRSLQACIHVDNTSRVQIVDKSTNILIYEIISNLKTNYNIPGLLNTSFNLRGEPMVNSALDAITTFVRSGMNALVLGDYLVIK